MAKMKDGGPTFPVSLRDWFAGQAIIGLAAGDIRGKGFASDVWAKNAYRLADAVLAERERKEKTP